MAATNETERHGAVERAGSWQRRHRASTGICQHRMRHAFRGRRSGADQAVLRLKKHANAGGHVMGDEGRDADAEIYQHSLFELACDAAGDDDLWLHWRAHVFATT